MKKLRLLSSKITLFSTLIIFVTMAIITSITYVTMRSFFIKESIQNLQNETELISNDIENSLIKLENDLAVLSKTPPIDGIVRSDENNGQDPLENSNITIWKDRLAVIFASILKVNPEYTKIRYIGVKDNGKELVRVDQSRGDTFRTDDSALQSRSDDSYYQQGIKLSQGSIRFSPITYNVEKGKITVPLTLTLRVMMPIYTKKQKIFGLLIINVNIQNYLQNVLNRTDKDYDVILYDKFNDFFIYNYKNQTLAFYQANEKIPEGIFGNPSIKTTSKIISYLKSYKNSFIVTKKIHSSLTKNSEVLTMLIATPKSRVLGTYHSLLNNLLLAIIVTFPPNLTP
ncbi:hypothetical protein [Candidiatus Paracoxiella cheracis]|uniref:hypothetical protein n=1 Tax=Candidiatus Paracoxiella cheracis TaxID=3405120 RepID=UPI003BF4ABE7